MAAQVRLPQLLPARPWPPRLRGHRLVSRTSAANPTLTPVVDQLQAEHRQVAELLHEVEAAALALDAGDTAHARARVRDALLHLANHLLAHLAFEEESLAPTLRSLTVPPWMVQGS